MKIMLPDIPPNVTTFQTGPCVLLRILRERVEENRDRGRVIPRTRNLKEIEDARGGKALGSHLDCFKHFVIRMADDGRSPCAHVVDVLVPEGVRPRVGKQLQRADTVKNKSITATVIEACT